MFKSFFFILSLLFSLTLLSLIAPIGSNAATTKSNCVVTKVGNPGEQPLPPECGTRGKFVYYCQNDYQYCDIASSGCGPTSFAMVLSTFGIPTTPPQASDMFKSAGARSCGEGSIMPKALDTLLPPRGFTYKLILSNKSVGVENASIQRPALNLTLAKEYLDQGYLIIGSVEGHIFVVDDVNTSVNQVHMQDPAGPGCRTRNQGGYWANNNFPWLGNSWYYAYVIKKIK